MRDECYKLKRRQEQEAKGEIPPRPTCDFCHKVGHTADRCYHNPDREIKAKTMKLESEGAQERPTSKNGQQKSSMKATTSNDLNSKRHDSDSKKQ